MTSPESNPDPERAERRARRKVEEWFEQREVEEWSERRSLAPNGGVPLREASGVGLNEEDMLDMHIFTLDSRGREVTSDWPWHNPRRPRP